MKFIGIVSSLFILSAAAMEEPETMLAEKAPMAIHVAAKKGDLMTFMSLKSQKINTNAPDADGNTPLMLALMGLKEFTEERKKNPSQFYAYSEDGTKIDKHTTASLIYAGYFNMINLLLSKHPDLTTTNKKSISVRDLINESPSKAQFEEKLNFKTLFSGK